MSVAGLTVTYSARKVLDAVELTLAEGESLAVVGRSGSGKSTLLSCILGLLQPDSGRIAVDGVQVEAGRRRAARLRREKVGMIFQNGQLLPELTPMENVVIAALLAGQPPQAAHANARELLERLAVPLRSETIGSFSGGEQQRVAVARALVNRPRLLLADEPTGSLDIETRDQVVQLLHTLPDEFGCALVVVTHDLAVAASCGRRTRLLGGRLEPMLTPTQL